MKKNDMNKGLLAAYFMLVPSVFAVSQYKTVKLAEGYVPYDINDSGEILVSYYTGISSHLGLWKNGAIEEINYGDHYSGQVTDVYPIGINNNGSVIFNLLESSSWTWTGVSRIEGRVSSLSGLRHQKINNKNQIVCVTKDESNSFLREPTGEMVDFGNHEGHLLYGSSLNDSTQIAGGTDLYSDTLQGFIWSQESGLMNLKPCSGDVSSIGIDINNKGQVVGCSSDKDPRYSMDRRLEMVLWDNSGTPIDLGISFDVFERININDQGIIAGCYWSIESEIKSIYWDPQAGLIDPQELLGVGSPYTISRIYGINNCGQMIAEVYTDIGSPCYVLLSPIPEPCTAAFLLGGACLIRKIKSYAS